MVAAETGLTNIWVAAADGDLERVRQLVQNEYSKTSCCVRDPNGYTPLHAAASYGQVEVVKYLLGANARPKRRRQWRRYPASLLRKRAGGQLLVKYGASPMIKNNNEQTPLDVAIEDERTEMVVFLKTITDENGNFDGMAPDET